MKPSKKNYHLCHLDDSQANELKKLLQGQGFEFESVPYSEWAAVTKDLRVILYSKGKLMVQGKATEEFVQFTLEPQILQSISFGYEGVLAGQSGVSHIGVDESGKGDYFGPLVIASAFVEKEKIALLVDQGVRDSKKLSESAITRLARLIKKECVFSLVSVGPERYNDLYGKIKNLNRLLAWGHARAIENILEKVDCKEVVLDQFGAEYLVKSALMEKGRLAHVKQMHHGEEDIAVAAASILARDEFVKNLSALGKVFGLELPRGAGPEVERIAKIVFEKVGLENLHKFAKVHFKTTARISSSS